MNDSCIDFLPAISDEEPFKDLKGLRTQRSDFVKCKIIGRGAFGEVQVVSQFSLAGLFGLIEHEVNILSVICMGMI